MKRYDTYKDSGVQWLGEIPGHWDCVPFKSVFDLGKGLSITKENLKNSGINVISYGQIHSKNNKFSYVIPELYRYVDESYLITNPQSLANKEDFLFADTSEDVEGSGNFVRIDNEETIFAGYHTIIAKNKKSQSGNYLAYLLQSNKWKMQIWVQVHGIKVFSITRSILNSTKLLLPPLPEQHSIVTYLDDKCGKIDKMVEGKQKQIELLAEMKQRIIADAVTRGLNPDVETKESGIFWIKNIPSHWTVRRLGHILSKENRERPVNAELLVCTNKAKVIKRGDSKMGLVADSEDVYQGVKKGDLLIHGMDTWHGAIAISDYDGMCTPVVHVCTSNEDVGFISLYLRYMAMMKVFKLISNGVRQNTSDFRSWAKVAIIPCPLPPLSEQKTIVSLVERKSKCIDTLTSKLQQEIESIKEYKQRLISDVVTGQIKVC